MQQACRELLGRKDFSSFQGADADTLDPGREVFKAEWARESPFLLAFVIEGDGFLKHMVRNLVGTLVEVGRGKTSGEEFRRILEARDRRQAGMTAPPQGLFLVKVEY